MPQFDFSPRKTVSLPVADTPVMPPDERQLAPDHVEPVVEHRDPTPSTRVRVPSFLLERPSSTQTAIAEAADRRAARKGLTR